MITNGDGGIGIGADFVSAVIGPWRSGGTVEVNGRRLRWRSSFPAEESERRLRLAARTEGAKVGEFTIDTREGI